VRVRPIFFCWLSTGSHQAAVIFHSAVLCMGDMTTLRLVDIPAAFALKDRRTARITLPLRVRAPS
jgi:hypothetical protein